MPNLPKKTFSPLYVPAQLKQWATGDQAFLKSAAWVQTSKSYREDFPLCENCYQKGRLIDAAVVDHMIPRPIGDHLDRRNLMSLCHVCHNQKSGKESHAGGPLIAHAGGVPVDRTEIFKILR